MKHITDAVTRASELFDLPSHVTAGQFRITVTGRGHVYIENHRGICDYAREKIVVNGGRTMITLSGERLEISRMSRSEMLITGCVSEISLTGSVGNG